MANVTHSVPQAADVVKDIHVDKYSSPIAPHAVSVLFVT